jgi:hypothetical protein
MKAVKELPVGYESGGSIDFSTSKTSLVVVNVFALLLMGLFIWLGVWFLGLIHPGVDAITALWRVIGGLTGFTGRLVIVVVALFFTFVAGIVHELVHGLFFWIFTRERPSFGAKSLYLYAAAPDWYLPRDQHVVVGLMPLVLITLVSIGVAAFTPPTVSAWVLLFAVANASGAAGDILAVTLLLRQSPEVLVHDTGVLIDIYRPGRGQGPVKAVEQERA